MHRIELSKNLDLIQLECMSEWLKTHTDGYLGEGQAYFTDDETLTLNFMHVAFIPSDEDAIMFKLTFNI